MERDISLSQHMALHGIKQKVSELRRQAEEINMAASEIEASYVPELERELGLAEGDLHDVTKVEIEAKGDVRRITFKSKAERDELHRLEWGGEGLQAAVRGQCDADHEEHGRCMLFDGHSGRHTGYVSGGWCDGPAPLRHDRHEDEGDEGEDGEEVAAA